MNAATLLVQICTFIQSFYVNALVFAKFIQVRLESETAYKSYLMSEHVNDPAERRAWKASKPLRIDVAGLFTVESRGFLLDVVFKIIVESVINILIAY